MRVGHLMTRKFGLYPHGKVGSRRGDGKQHVVDHHLQANERKLIIIVIVII